MRQPTCEPRGETPRTAAATTLAGVAGGRAIRLVKWYFDLIEGSGRCAIGYWARLEGYGLTVTYASTLTAAPGVAARTRVSLAQGEFPCVDGGGVAWSHAALRIRGRWQTGEKPVRHTLIRTPEGQVDWTLHAAAAEATLESPEGLLRGSGYVECLEMTVRPWSLPIHKLRWGRAAAGEGGTVVWIEWRGPEHRKWLLQDGNLIERGIIGDRSVEWDVGGRVARLELEPCVTLRDGALGPQVLSRIPGVCRLPPAAFLRSRETKWLSRARLNRGGIEPVAGWAIHERVVFNGMERS